MSDKRNCDILHFDAAVILCTLWAVIFLLKRKSDFCLSKCPITENLPTFPFHGIKYLLLKPRTQRKRPGND
jgi:hypothetical protein